MKCPLFRNKITNVSTYYLYKNNNYEKTHTVILFQINKYLFSDKL